jgi:hypothetical protein
LLLSVAIGFLTRPADLEVLLPFYSRVRPFGFWGPVRKEAARRGLVPANDHMPRTDALNGVIGIFFQAALAIVPFCLFLRQWGQCILWLTLLLALSVVLYRTWYRNLPPATEGQAGRASED